MKAETLLILVMAALVVALVLALLLMLGDVVASLGAT